MAKKLKEKEEEEFFNVYEIFPHQVKKGVLVKIEDEAKLGDTPILEFGIITKVEDDGSFCAVFDKETRRFRYKGYKEDFGENIFKILFNNKINLKSTTMLKNIKNCVKNYAKNPTKKRNTTQKKKTVSTKKSRRTTRKM